MWWKLFLLTLYLTVLFVLSRILEAVSYYEGGYLASRLLDPVSLSVRRLKAILDQRGVSYTGVVERTELKELVRSSGEVTTGEMDAAALSLTDDASLPPTTATVDDVSTNFTCGSHFYEEVEDTKDSVWVVQVLCHNYPMVMPRTDWKAFIKKVARFGVRTGIFDCSLDQFLCNKKQWRGAQLVLAMPAGYQAKDHVVLKSYSGSPRSHKVFDWVNHNLASRITKISSVDELTENWLHFGRRSKTEQIRVILFSSMVIPPMFYTVLSVKFSGRAKFGVVNIDSSAGKEMLATMNLSTTQPTYVVLTPTKKHTFGSAMGEYLTYNSMALLLRTLHPEVNDMFLLSLIIVNAACSFEFFITSGGVLKRFGQALWDVVKWNFLLILLWLPVLGLFQLPYMDHVFECMLRALRHVAMTSFAGCIRADWLWYWSVGWVFVAITFLSFAVVVGLLHYISVEPSENPPGGNPAQSGFWNFQWESYMSNLVAPSLMAATYRGGYVHTVGMDMGLLIERLAIPNPWLRPVSGMSSQYIDALPVWRYTGPCIDSDVGSDSECNGRAAESDTSANGFGPRPMMFVCEKCRLLQSVAGKTPQELEQERIESESACAKYVMDGDYKCQCGLTGSSRDSTHGGRSPARGSRYRSASKTDRRATEDMCTAMPPGMIATLDCSICLESYKPAILLCGLPCGHSFHQQCIMGWLSRDNHCCPICRWPAYKAKPCTEHQHSD